MCHPVRLGVGLAFGFQRDVGALPLHPAGELVRLVALEARVDDVRGIAGVAIPDVLRDVVSGAGYRILQRPGHDEAVCSHLPCAPIVNGSMTR